MPRLWRLVRPEHAPGLDGEGARLFGGRWNSPGHPLIYTSATLSLALLEVWVHLHPDQRRAGSLADFVKVAVELPPSVAVERYEAAPAELVDHRITRAFGDRWLTEGRAAVLSVPSAVIPEEPNLLLNPLHPDFAQVAVALQLPFRFDERLAL
ncbi:MAG: RES family NAD+ phosphorylase [Paracoccaceae bacterium]